jgi:hypothetical protein
MKQMNLAPPLGKKRSRVGASRNYVTALGRPAAVDRKSTQQFVSNCLAIPPMPKTCDATDLQGVFPRPILQARWEIDAGRIEASMMRHVAIISIQELLI